MKLISLLILICLVTSCLNKPNSIEKETLREISSEYRNQLQSMLAKDKSLLESHKLSLIKFSLVTKTLKAKHPTYVSNSQLNNSEVFKTTLDKLDPLRLLFTESEVQDIISKIPREELNFLSPPVVFSSLVKTKVLNNLAELQHSSQAFIKEKARFDENKSFFTGDNPPRSKSTLQKIDQWYIYLSGVVTQLAVDENLTLIEATLNEKKLKQELTSFVANFINNHQTNLKDPQFLINLTLNELMHSADEFSSYLPPEVSSNFKRKISLDSVSLGFDFRIDLNHLTITSVYSATAGVASPFLVGDKIYKVTTPTDSYSFSNLPKLMSLLNSPPETELGFVIKRNGKEELIKLVPKVLEDKTKMVQSFTFLNSKTKSVLGFIKIPQFYITSNSSAQLENILLNLITRFNNQKVKGIVIDLRNNSGGSFPAVFPILSLFLRNGPILQEKTIDTTIVHRLEEHSLVFEGKIVVLVNQFSASSAEILANALKERGRAVIVGTNTFGKGSIQEIINLSSYLTAYPDLAEYRETLGLIKVTRSSFHKLNGQALHNKGVKPDIQISSLTPNGKQLKPISFPTLNEVEHEAQEIKQLPELKSASLARQQKSLLFNKISLILQEETDLKDQEQWIFTNINTVYQTIEARKSLNQKKNNLKTKETISSPEFQDPQFINQLQQDHEGLEAIHILEDYVK